jgi:4-carboxymuconolactone decarboxylase
MLPPDPTARIAPLRPEEFSDQAKAMFARWKTGILQGADTNPVLKTLVHHPHLTDVFAPLNIHLLTTNSVPMRLRQLAIMRTAWLCKATYMWSSHMNLSLALGLEPNMFRPLQSGGQDPYFTQFERVVLCATEELVEDHKIGDVSWDALQSEWSEAQMLDFMFTVGLYVAIAGVMRSVRIERAPDLIALAEIYGAPE